MRCECCNREIENGQVKCSVCGFPTLSVGTVDVSAVVEEYRKKKLKDISIYFKTYHYNLNNGALVIEKMEYIKIADALSLICGEVYWFENSFEKLESDREIVLEISVSNGDESKDFSVVIKPDDIISHEKIGIVLEDGFSIRFVIGTQEKNVISEEISLI